MTKESKKIEQSIEQLNSEKEKLKNQLKPIPQGIFIKKYIGHSLSTGQPKYIRELTLNDKPISKEKLDELKKRTTEHNEPIIKRLNEIDNLLPLFEVKLNNAKADEILNDNSKHKESKSDKNKRDKRPHDQAKFIDTFIEKSKQIIFNNRTDIAKNCNVSKTWITNHFNLPFLEKLSGEMNTELNQIIDSESKSKNYISYEDDNLNEVFMQNFAYIKKLLENKTDSAKFSKARNELRKTIKSKT